MLQAGVVRHSTRPSTAWPAPGRRKWIRRAGPATAAWCGHLRFFHRSGGDVVLNLTAQMAIQVLTVPVVAPLVQSLGFDLVWFGVIKIVTAELGMVTPPFGLNAFIVSKYSGTPLKEVFIGTWPHIIAIGILLLFPSLSLWLPNNM